MLNDGSRSALVSRDHMLRTSGSNSSNYTPRLSVLEMSLGFWWFLRSIVGSSSRLLNRCEGVYSPKLLSEVPESRLCIVKVPVIDREQRTQTFGTWRSEVGQRRGQDLTPVVPSQRVLRALSRDPSCIRDSARLPWTCYFVAFLWLKDSRCS